MGLKNCMGMGCPFRFVSCKKYKLDGILRRGSGG